MKQKSIERKTLQAFGKDYLSACLYACFLGQKKYQHLPQKEREDIIIEELEKKGWVILNVN